MAKFIFMSDIVEKNGKTIKENNLEKKHKYPLNSLVELENGERLYIFKHTRDCDGSPLYSLGFKFNEEVLSSGHGEESLTPLTSETLGG